MSEDFFGDLGQSISKVTQTAVRKTGSFFESTKISSSLTTEQKQIEKLYSRIGEAVVRKTKSGAEIIEDQEVLEYIGQVRRHLDAVLELKQSLAGVKGMRLCISCQELVSPKMAFCPYCGAPLPIEDEPEEEPAEELPDIFAEESVPEPGSDAEDSPEAQPASEEKSEEPEPAVELEELENLSESISEAGFTTLDDIEAAEELPETPDPEETEQN